MDCSHTCPASANAAPAPRSGREFLLGFFRQGPLLDAFKAQVRAHADQHADAIDAGVRKLLCDFACMQPGDVLVYAAEADVAGKSVLIDVRDVLSAANDVLGVIRWLRSRGSMKELLTGLCIRNYAGARFDMFPRTMVALLAMPPAEALRLARDVIDQARRNTPN